MAKLKIKAANLIAAGARSLNLLNSGRHRGSDRLAVLTYHRVAPADERSDLDRALVSASPEQFAEHMDTLGEHFEFVSADQVVDSVRSHQALPPNALLVTFDDAYAEFATHAWPVLRERQIPAVMFAPTAFPDARCVGFWWDRLHALLHSGSIRHLPDSPWAQRPLPGNRHKALKRLKRWLKQKPPRELEAWVTTRCQEQGVTTSNSVLTWAALEQLAGEGLAVCAHTRNHPILTRLSEPELRCEIETSIRDIRKRFHRSPPLFAYPSGFFDERCERVCEAAGVALAFTTDFGLARLDRAHWRQPRIDVRGGVTGSTLHAQIRAAHWLGTANQKS